MAEVAVVIPAYNAAGTLPATLESLLAQSHGDFEAVVVDDGSSDDTACVAAGTGDSRVRVLSIPNGGVAAARNHGITETESPYVAFLDADDLWHREKLERQLEALRQDPGAGICVTGAVRIDAASRELGTMPLRSPGDACRDLLLHSMVFGCLSSGLARRGVLEQVGYFDPRFSQSADWDLWLRLALVTRFAIVDRPLVSYRTAPGNMSSNIRLLEHDTFAVLDSFFAQPEAARYLGLRGRAYSAHWLVCSGSYLHAGRPIDAARCLAHALRSHPVAFGRAVGLPARWLRRRLVRAGGSR